MFQYLNNIYLPMFVLKMSVEMVLVM